MTTLSVKNYIPRGNLAARAGLLAARLEKKEYRPETILSMDQAGWPGDWEGRTILALVRLAQTTKKEPAYLHEIVDIVLAGRNARGYLGVMLDDGMANEQQLSGHSWLLRGLCAYYGYTGRQDIYDAALTIGRNLFLPLKDTYPTYPNRPEERVYGGDMAGKVANVVGKWYISTDTGCAFIPLDGVSALYEMTGDNEIGALLDVMIENFLKIDFLGIRAQTHATLTATRGILRTYRMTGKACYLDAAKTLFSMYMEHGMTANYANYNWFGRPEWTEPCAVIDSFLCAMQLYAATGARDYITTAQRIYYNGMGFGQRENGGFGCDTCLGALGRENNRILRKHCEEAYWCCSMRGGEGLASAAEYAYLVDGSTVVVPYFSSADAEVPIGGGVLRLSQKVEFPAEGKVLFRVAENTAAESITLSCYLPDTARNIYVEGALSTYHDGMLSVTITAETTAFRIGFTLPYHAEPAVGAHNDPTARAVFRGNLMYSVTTDVPLDVTAEQLAAGVEGMTLRPLFDAYETDHMPRQVLFS